MRITKKTGIIAIVLVAAIALMGFGFAAWSTTLKASGTYSASGKWLVQWKSCTESHSSVGVTYTAPESLTPSVSQITKTETTNDTLNLGSVKFSIPGAWVKYHCVVENAGDVTAYLSTTNVKLTGIEDSNILWKIAGGSDNSAGTICSSLAPSGKCEFDVVIWLDKNYSNSTLNVSPQGVQLTIKEYSPASAPDVPTASHSHP